MSKHQEGVAGDALSAGGDARATMWDGRPRPSDCRKRRANVQTAGGRRLRRPRYRGEHGSLLGIDEARGAGDAFPGSSQATPLVLIAEPQQKKCTEGRKLRPAVIWEGRPPCRPIFSYYSNSN